MVIGVGAAGYGTVNDLSVRAIFPLLYAAVAVHFLPLLWARNPDPFCPAAYSGLATGYALLGVMVSVMLTGRLEFSGLPWLRSPAHQEEVMSLVCAVYVVGTLAYYGGYYLTSGRWVQGLFPQRLRAPWRRSRLMMITAGCAFAFLPAYAFFQSRVGTTLTDLALAEGKSVWKEDPTLSWMHRGIALGFIPVLLHVALAFKRSDYRRLMGLAALSVVLAFLSVRVGTRGNAVFFLLNLVMLAHYLYRRVPIVALLGGALVLIAFTNVLGAARSQGPGADLEVTFERFKPGQALAEHEGDRQRLTAAAVVMDTFPERQDYLLGASWTAMLVAPVPRPLLPDKNSYLRWSDSGITYSLVGVPAPTPFLFLLFANFGWAGIGLGMASWGMFHRGLQAWRENGEGDLNVTLLYSTILLYFTPTLLAVAMCLQTVVPVWMALWFMGRRSPWQAYSSRGVTA